jgi:hypothetical protein
MRNGFESGFVLGNSSGPKTGLHSGLQSNSVMTNRINMLDPNTIIEPKLKPVFYINADNVALTSGSISIAYNLINSTSGELFPKIENIFDQTAGTTYRPPLVLKGLNGRNYMNFGDTGNRYLASAITPASVYMYASTSPLVSGQGMTYMFVIKRIPGGTRTIVDGRDSSTLATTNDLLIEVNSEGRITFDYKGGNSGAVTSFTGTAGVNLLNDWSILTVKTQLRNDGGDLPSDSDGADCKRFLRPIDARVGTTSPLDIFVNGIEQQKTVTTNTFTNADWFNDGSFRMLDRDIYIGNKGSVFATSGTHIAAALMIPTYISKAYQQRLENYFRNYYSLPF